MGIIDKIGNFIGDKLADVSALACDKVVAGIAKNKLDEDKFLDGEPTHSRLILMQNAYAFKESFEVVDRSGNVKYIVKGKLLALTTHKLAVFDERGLKKFGEVEESKSPVKVNVKGCATANLNLL